MRTLEPIEGHRDLKRDPENGRIYVRMFKGSKKRELFKSTRTDNLRKARKIADQFIEQYLGSKPRSQAKELTFEIWPKWYATKDDKTKATLDSISNTWRRLQPFFGDLFPSEINSMAWENYIAKMKDFNPEQKFFNDRKWFKSFIIWLHENGMVEKLPKLRNPDPKQSKIGKYVTHEEFKQLLSKC